MRQLTIPAALAVLMTAGPAFAHAHLEKADPRVGSTVAAAPSRLWLRFSEIIRPHASGVQLVGPDGKATVLALSQDPQDKRAVIAPLPAGLAPGKYLVRWRALSPDGHRTEGDFSFSIKG
jgi:methionine-rich copper-binding protein CopC